MIVALHKNGMFFLGLINKHNVHRGPKNHHVAVLVCGRFGRHSLLMSVARFSSGGVAIRYVLPFYE